jgi:hypothetical protein
MSVLRNILVKSGLSERRQFERVPVKSLEADYWTGGQLKTARVKDLSALGLYLLTSDHSLPDAPIHLTLHSRGFHDDTYCKVRFRAQAKRHCKDGVGMAFVFDHIDNDSWLELLEKAAGMTVRIDQIRLFRIAKALAFIRRVSPDAENQFVEIFAADLSRERSERAVELILSTEEAIEEMISVIRNDVAADLIMRILLESSKTADDLIQACWRGLFVHSVEPGSIDNESLIHATLLSQLIPLQYKIFASACERAISSGWEPNSDHRDSMKCTVELVRRIAGIKNLTVIERDLHYLHELGLLEATIKPPTFQEINYANLTPTRVGLNFFLYCGGFHSEALAPECTSPRQLSTSGKAGTP